LCGWSGRRPPESLVPRALGADADGGSRSPTCLESANAFMLIRISVPRRGDTGPATRVARGVIPTQIGGLRSSPALRRLSTLDVMSPPSTTRAAGAAWWLQGWQHVIFLVLNLLTGTVAVVLLSLILVGAAGLLAAGAGVVLLIPGMWGAWLLAQGELARIEVFTGTRIRPEPPSQENRWFHYLGISRAHRRAAIYTAVHALWGLVSGALIAGLTAAVVAVLAMPLYASRIPEEGLALLWFRLDSFNTQAALWGAALGLLLILPLLARQITAVDRQLVRSLLGVDPDAEIAQLSERVETLTSSREETVDSVEAERRRIERDLHDGPQQRLVAIAMDLG